MNGRVLRIRIYSIQDSCFLTTRGTGVCFATEPLGTHANLLFGWALARRLAGFHTRTLPPPLPKKKPVSTLNSLVA